MSETVAASETMIAIQRRLTLDVLERFGTLALEAIPRAWPVARRDMQALVAELEESGAVESRWDPLVPGRRMARITEAGSLMRRQMNNDAMRAAAPMAEHESGRPAANGYPSALRPAASRRPAWPAPDPA